MISIPVFLMLNFCDSICPGAIETVSPEGTFCDTVQVPSSAVDMELN